MPACPPTTARLRSLSGRRLAVAAVAALPLLALSPAAAFATDGRTLIDFTGDEGFSGTHYTSPAHDGVTFCDAGGGSIDIGDFGSQSDGAGLAAYPTVAMTFAQPVDSLQLAFGNDDPGYITAEHGTAVLTVFLGKEQVAQQVVAVNANDNLDQTIEQSGGPAFNRATLAYADPTMSSEWGGGELIMIVDNVYVGAPVDSLNPATTCAATDPDPEPDPEPEPEPEPTGPAECTITGTEEADELVGTPGDDVICGLGGDDILRGLGGNDILRGGAGADTIRGNGGDDVLRGHDGRDQLFGGAGADSGHGGPMLDFATDIEQVRSAKVVVAVR